MKRILYSSEEDDVSILSITHCEPTFLQMTRHVLMVEGPDVFQLSSCSVQSHSYHSFHPSKFAAPLFQYFSKNQFFWMDGYGSNSLMIVVFHFHQCICYDLMKDKSQSPSLHIYHHQVPLHAWYIDEQQIGIVTVLWHATHAHRPILWYRILTIGAGKRLRKKHEQTLQIHQILRIYHGGVKQNQTMYWNVDPSNEDFPIQLGKQPKFIAPRFVYQDPPVPIQKPIHADEQLFLHMEGPYAKYVDIQMHERECRYDVHSYPCRILPLIREIVAKWTWMTLRPPKTLDSDDLGGYAYRKYERKFYERARVVI